MTGHAVYTEHYFPPRGHTAHMQRDPDRGWTWFPMHLLLAELGRCSSCPAPATYLTSSLSETNEPYITAICMAACDAHVCELATLVTGHQHCPKCHFAWAEQPGPALAERGDVDG